MTAIYVVDTSLLLSRPKITYITNRQDAKDAKNKIGNLVVVRE